MKQSEAIVLRSYPVHEADLLVTFFTRAEGKLRGVAKSAKKSRKRFGGALEPLTHVRLYWEDREGNELARIDSCDVLDSPLNHTVDYPRAVALGYVAELLEQLLPDREANDAVFRLAISVLHNLRAGNVWMPVTYFDLWIVRLMGLLPELHECIECGELLNGRAYFHALSDGLMCPEHKRLASTEMSADSRRLAAEMFRSPLDSFQATAPWPRLRGADLRMFLTQRVERHLEKKLVSGAMLDRLD